MSAADACAAAVAAVNVTSGWLTAASDGEAGHLMQITDVVSDQLAELQLTMGEGPSLDASASGGPVLASDLGTAETGHRWPAFTPAACQAGAGAIFAFPLRTGAIRAGVLGMYRIRPGRQHAANAGDRQRLGHRLEQRRLQRRHQPAAAAANAAARRTGEPANPARSAPRWHRRAPAPPTASVPPPGRGGRRWACRRPGTPPGSRKRRRPTPTRPRPGPGESTPGAGPGRRSAR